MTKKTYRLNKKAHKKQYRLSKKELKNNYKNIRKNLRNQYISEIDLESKEKQIVNPPYRTVLEEIGNSVTHGIGSILSIVFYVLMLIHSNTVNEYIASTIYFLGLFFEFTMSTLYHAFPYGSKVKRIFRRFDYSSIYLLIGASFAPILLCYIGGIYGTIFVIIQWIIIITGVTLVAVFGPTRLKFIHFPLYFILGWSALIFVPKMFVNDFNLFLYILGGGIIYTLGIIPFFIDKKVSHFIWLFFVLAGAIVQWLGIYIYLYLK